MVASARPPAGRFQAMVSWGRTSVVVGAICLHGLDELEGIVDLLAEQRLMSRMVRPHASRNERTVNANRPTTTSTARLSAASGCR